MKILLMALVVAGMVGTVIPAQGGRLDDDGMDSHSDETIEKACTECERQALDYHESRPFDIGGGGEGESN